MTPPRTPRAPRYPKVAMFGGTDLGGFTEVPIERFVTDGYQRPRIEAHVKTIAEAFGPEGFTPPVASPIGDGETLEILDGQHTVAACAQLGVNLVPTWIPSIGQEATVVERSRSFAIRNTMRVRVRDIDRFRAELMHDEKARTLLAAVERAGFQIGTNNGRSQPGQIRAIRAIEMVRDSYSLAHLERTLEVWKAGWPFDAPQSAPLRALASFLEDRPDEVRAVRMMAAISPQRLRTECAANSAGGEGRVTTMADLLRFYYKRQRA